MRICWLVACSALGAGVHAAERHYPVVGPDGRLQVITSPATQGATSPFQLLESAPSQLPKAVDPTGPASVGEIPDKVQEGGESWLTTEQLERKGFKPDGKNRFYYLPDGSMGLAPLESDAGIPVISAPKAESSDIVSAVRPSPNYRILDKQMLMSVLGWVPVCLSKRERQGALSVLELKRLAIEPPLSITDKSPDKVIALRGVKSNSAIRLVSYAQSGDNPAFFMPVAVWLGEDGCLISAAWNFWTKEIPGSEFRYPGIESVLLVPEQAVFLAFYRHRGSEALPFRLQQQGVLSLEIFE